ncbi:MAG: GyrI-like domain-containing protein, partial [Acidimicrobiales bacterium]
HKTTTTYEQVFAEIPNGFGLVFDRLQQANTEPSGIPFTIFHRAPDAEGPGEVEMCIPVAATTRGVPTREIEGGPVAAVIHQGPYDQMGPAYEALARWIAEHGHEAVGPTREIYMNHPTDVAPDGLLTELQWPIDGQEMQ